MSLRSWRMSLFLMVLWFRHSRGWQSLGLYTKKSISISFHLNPFSFPISKKIASHSKSYQADNILLFFNAMLKPKSLMVLQGLIIKSRLSSSAFSMTSAYYSYINSLQHSYLFLGTMSSTQTRILHNLPKDHVLWCHHLQYPQCLK